jgi:hypothetical protein
MLITVISLRQGTAHLRAFRSEATKVEVDDPAANALLQE